MYASMTQVRTETKELNTIQTGEATQTQETTKLRGWPPMETT